MIDDLLTLIEIYKRSGDTDEYDEDVTLRSHSLQTADLLFDWTGDPELAVAGFLHDIGHASATPDVSRHGELGAEMIEGFFSDRVRWLVLNHTNAKRYLVATDPDYFARLSKRSQETYLLQGGVLEDAEIERLDSSRWRDDLLTLRRADDSAKQLSAVTRTIDFWVEVTCGLAIHTTR